METQEHHSYITGLGLTLAILVNMEKVILLFKRLTSKLPAPLKRLKKEPKIMNPILTITSEVLTLLPILLAGLGAAEQKHANGGKLTDIITAFLQGASASLPAKE